MRRLCLCKLDSELAREKESRRLFALVLIEGISREEAACPQVGGDELIPNYC